MNNTTDSKAVNIQNGGMELYENRLKSFDAYPKQMLPDKFKLARAGLSYTGKSDMCHCSYCGVLLNQWNRDDDAMTEHYKYSPDCPFIKMVGAPKPMVSNNALQAGVGGFRPSVPSNAFVRPFGF